jgi:hypothetical protein
MAGARLMKQSIRFLQEKTQSNNYAAICIIFTVSPKGHGACPYAIKEHGIFPEHRSCNGRSFYHKKMGPTTSDGSS